MAIYQKPIITNLGKNLYAKVLAGTTELKIVSVKYGSGKITTENQEELTSLINYELDGTVASLQKNDNNSEAYINVSLNNSTITSTVNICEIGLFADDPDLGTILYAYTNAGDYGDPVTQPTTSVSTWAYRFILGISNDISVTINMTESSYDFDVLSSSDSLESIAGSDQKVINESIDQHITKLNKNQIYWIGSLSHSDNVYTVSLDEELEVGLAIAFLSTNATTGNVSINYNGQGAVLVKKISGNNLNNIKANSIQTFRWNGTNFMQASGGADDVTFTSDKLLAGYNANNSDGEKVDGTMANRGAVTSTLSCGGSYTIPAGYHNGAGKITANSLASQTSGTATAGQILSGYTAWINGSKVTGSIASQGAQTITPSTTNKTIASGKYLSGVQTILGDADLIASNIISGKNIFGVNGTATVESLGGIIGKSGVGVSNYDGSISGISVQHIDVGFQPDIIIVYTTDVTPEQKAIYVRNKFGVRIENNVYGCNLYPDESGFNINVKYMDLITGMTFKWFCIKYDW